MKNAIVVGLLLAATANARAPESPAPEPEAPAAQAWLAGDAAEAARRLEGAVDRVSVLNRGVALVYAGDASGAESELQRLVDREPAWTPALRWLARARAAAGSREWKATLERLLRASGADSRDFLWAGRVWLNAGEAERAAVSLREAVAREPDLYLGWLWLGDAEAALARAPAARAAWQQASKLHAGGELLVRLGVLHAREGQPESARAAFEAALATPEGRPLEATMRELVPDLPPLPAPSPVGFTLAPGETLRYSARYLFFRFATLELSHQGFAELHGRRVARIVVSVRSRPGFPLLKIDSRFESLIAEDGSVLSHRSTSRDSTDTNRAAVYEMNPDDGSCTVRQVVEELFGFETLPLPPLGQDGLSILPLARVVARSRSSLSVLTAVDSTWKGTELVARGRVRADWAGCEREAVQVDLVANYRGPAGLSGRVSALVSADARALPYRAAIKLRLGSAVLELDPAALSDREQATACPSPNPARY